MTAESGNPQGLAPANPGVIAALHETPVTVNPLRDPRDRRIPRVAGPCVLVMFGVTGDLARKKLMPAIYDLANRGLLPPGFSFVGFARRDWEDEDFAQVTYQAVKEYARTPFRDAVWEQLSEGVRFVSGSFSDDAAFDELAETVHGLDDERSTGGNYAFYLSIPPSQFPTVVEQLKRSGLSDSHGRGWRRVGRRCRTAVRARQAGPRARPALRAVRHVFSVEDAQEPAALLSGFDAAGQRRHGARP